MEENQNLKTLNEMSPFKGLYGDKLVTKENELIAMIRIEGINMDLMAEYEQNCLFEDYGTFLASLDEKIQTISMTVPLNTDRYELYWKRRVLEVEADDSKSPEVKKNLLQLISNEILHMQKISIDRQLTSKMHLLTISKKIKGTLMEDLKRAEIDLNDAIHRYRKSITEFMGTEDVDIEVLSADEILQTLQRFTDFKYSVFM